MARRERPRRPDGRLLVLLAAFVAIVAVVLGRPFLLPVALGLFLALVLRPVHVGLTRLRVPAWLSSLVVLGAVLLLVARGGYALTGPALAWLDVLPSERADLERRLTELARPVEEVREKVEEAADQVEQITERVAAAVEPEPTRVTLVDGDPTLVVLGFLRETSVMAFLALVICFFFLAFGHEVLQRLERLGNLGPVLEQAGRRVSRYLALVSAINLLLGVAVAAALYLLEVPNPLLWGTMAALLNFVPYLGAMVGTVVLLTVALFTFDSPGRIALVPVVYLVITSIEGFLLTPAILGQRFEINPIAIFLWLLFWGWVWGIPGALMAVPALTGFHIICEHVPPLRTFGWIIGRGPDPPPAPFSTS